MVQPFTVPNSVSRFSVERAIHHGGEWGPVGGGSCDDWRGPNGFGGALFEKVTLVIQWYDNLLRFFAFDGHWNLQNIGGAAGSLLGSWDYPIIERIPRGGPSRLHINLWQANWGGVPERARAVHVGVAGR